MEDQEFATKIGVAELYLINPNDEDCKTAKGILRNIKKHSLTKTQRAKLNALLELCSDWRATDPGPTKAQISANWHSKD